MISEVGNNFLAGSQAGAILQNKGPWQCLDTFSVVTVEVEGENATVI